MSRRSGLGRGLEALIPTGESPGEGISQIPIEQIRRNPRQPRARFDAKEIEALADSIRHHGMLQPIIVTRGGAPGEYVLIAGERRWLAARQAGMEKVPAIVRETSDQGRLLLALIENLQRADLNPLEEAEAYRQLAEDFELSHEEIAQRVCRSRSAVTNTLRLLSLPPSVKDALLEGRISEGHARALLALPTPQAQALCLETVLKNELSVRQTEVLVRRLSGAREAKTAQSPKPPEILDLEQRLQSSLGTRVNLRKGHRGGTITIHYYSDEELEALIERLLGG